MNRVQEPRRRQGDRQVGRKEAHVFVPLCSRGLPRLGGEGHVLVPMKAPSLYLASMGTGPSNTRWRARGQTPLEAQR